MVSASTDHEKRVTNEILFFEIRLGAGGESTISRVFVAVVNVCVILAVLNIVRARVLSVRRHRMS